MICFLFSFNYMIAPFRKQFSFYPICQTHTLKYRSSQLPLRIWLTYNIVQPLSLTQEGGFLD
ncbi:hypothetical protein D0A23_13360 [Bacillus amyloliquefaciens]|nr:hypothetical protein CFI04_19050 [Bacillus amyloliquefaciens]RHX68492.1 hypothetical protein D0A23_13360 [Bacillus amyloliquefaciens]